MLDSNRSYPSRSGALWRSAVCFAGRVSWADSYGPLDPQEEELAGIQLSPQEKELMLSREEW